MPLFWIFKYYCGPFRNAFLCNFVFIFKLLYLVSLRSRSYNIPVKKMFFFGRAGAGAGGELFKSFLVKSVISLRSEEHLGFSKKKSKCDQDEFDPRPSNVFMHTYPGECLKPIKSVL